MQYRKEAVYQQLLEAAMAEFDEKGYTDASIRTIAESANTSVGNLYRYFRNKDALYVSCLMPVLDECIDWTGKIFDISTPETIRYTARRISDYVHQHRREFRIIAQGPASHYSAFLCRFSACIERQLRHCAAPELHTANPKFLNTLANAFIAGMRQIMEDYDCEESTDLYLLEFMQFLFGDFRERLKNPK